MHRQRHKAQDSDFSRFFLRRLQVTGHRPRRCSSFSHHTRNASPIGVLLEHSWSSSSLLRPISSARTSSRRPASGTEPPRALPRLPILPSFIINTLCYAAIWFGLFFGIGAIRRWRRTIRRRRARCVKCGYNLRGDFSVGCPECGWQRESLDESKG